MWWFSLSLTIRILIGLALGILLGVLLGESASALAPVADAYVGLLQMTVLPYVVIALIVGLGQLDPSGARRLAGLAGALLLVTWAASILVIGTMPLAFPEYQNATFYSSALIESGQPFGIVALFIPSNPFHSMANGVVPAVVLFSAALGAALMGVPGKESVLSVLRVLEQAIARVTRFIVGLTPIGLFAIGAVTAGTISLQTLARLQVYLVSFAAAAMLLTFLVLPLIVTAVTPFKYREVVSVASDAMLTAFVTNNVFIVLPILIERSKELMARHNLDSPEATSAADVLIPMMFAFPNAGRLVSLLFVPFAAWLTGSPVEISDYPAFFTVGIGVYFAKAQVALPFLLDLLRIPQDMMRLYIPSTILNGKFDSVTSAMNFLMFALVGSGAMAGFLTLRSRRLIRAGIAIALGLAITIVGTRLILTATVNTAYDKDEVLKSMHLARGEVPMTVHRSRPTYVEAEVEERDLARIKRRGAIRVGYKPDLFPFTFFNSSDELVGFDVEIGGRLAEDLDVSLEFVPVEWSTLSEQLESGEIDIMFSVPYAVDALQVLRYSDSYLENHWAFAVRDERRHDFETEEGIKELGPLTIAVPSGSTDVAPRTVMRYLRRLSGEPVAIETAKSFFEGEHAEVDALFMRAEIAAAWTILYPEYAVVIPQPSPLRTPIGIVMRPGDTDLARFIDGWLRILQESGAVQGAYDYWILGQGAGADAGE
jgi:Na+/H+-dicarboxylate symporter